MTETTTSAAEQVALLAQYERERDTDRASIRALTDEVDRVRRAGAESDAWCDYWRQAAEQAGRDRDGHRATAEAAHREIDAVLQVLDVALVDPDAPDGDETGEPDDPGDLLDAAETVVTRLRLAEAEVVRLATEVERLCAGEMPLPGAPELTGGAR